MKQFHLDAARKFWLSFMVFLSSISGAYAQIWGPDGLRMPGDWNGWTNTNPMSGAFNLSLNGNRYTTTFQYTNTTGTNNFKFASGGSGNPWGNEWRNTNFSVNTLSNVAWSNFSPNPANNNNTIAVTQNKFYTVNFLDNGYQQFSQAIFMETDAAPVTLSGIAQSPLNGSIEDSDNVTVTFNTSSSLSANEKVYLRYAVNGNWAGSSLVLASVTGTSGTATIPAQSGASTVAYYLFTTTVTNPAIANVDMVTMRILNNSGANYSYTVNTPIPPVDITFQVDMNQQTVGGNVYMNGNFPQANGWTSPVLMSDPNSDGIYTVTLTLNQGVPFEYKFINGSNYEGNISAPCGNGSNRTYTVPTANATVPITCFGICGACPSLYQVTFQVNMSNETVSGAGVHIVGSFQGWSPGSTPMTSIGGGIYEYTTTLPTGPIQYKFINGNAWGQDETAIPGPCNTSGNRTYTVPATNSTVGPFCYNSCSNCVATTWTSIGSGNWDNPGTWNAGSVPPAGVNVVVAGGHTVTLNTNSAVINNLTINATGTLVGSDGTQRTLFIGGGGNFTENGTYTSTATGSVQFAGGNAVNGGVSFNNVILEGGVNFNLGSTITGVLQINSGGFINSNAPSYAANSILRYNTGGDYGRGLEWSATSGAGYPHHLEIINTALQPGANGGQGTARAIAGNLTIAPAGGLYMDWGGLEMTAQITVHGNVTLNGGLSLSSQIGGDMNVRGNFTMNAGAVFNGNQTSLNFNGTTPQTVGGTAAALNVVYASSNNAAGVTLNIPINVSNTFRAITGTLNSNGNLRLNSGGTLLHGVGTVDGGGSVAGNIVVRRQGHNTPSHNFYSAPVTGATTAVLPAQSYSYNTAASTSTTSDDGDEPGWVPASGVMTPGQGFTAVSAGNVVFTGTATQGAVNYPVVLSGNNCNLVGNPYPSPISANAFLAVNGPAGSNRIGGSLYFWDDDGSNGANYSSSDYAVWNGAGSVGGGGNTPNGNIATGQGFFVTANSAGNISFANSMRNDNDNYFFDAAQISRVRLNITNEHNMYNEILVAFLNGATEGEDALYDAEKLRGNSDLAFYSKIGNREMVIQGLPALTSDRVVDLGLHTTFAETHTIRLKDLENIPSTVMVYLIDKTLNVTVNLRAQNAYSFEATGDLNNRFELKFTAPVEVIATAETCSGNDGSISLSTEASEIPTAKVFNAQGELVFSNTTSGLEIGTSVYPAGVYQVELAFGGYTATVPVSVEATEPAELELLNVAANAVIFENIEFTAQSNGNITWDLGDGTIVTGESVQHSYTEPGIYTINLIAVNGNCVQIKSSEIAVRTDDATGVDASKNDQLMVFPNPSNGNINLSGDLTNEGGKFTVSLIDLSGRVVSSEVKTISSGNSMNLNFSNVAEGIYQLQISGNSSVYTTKMIIRK